MRVPTVFASLPLRFVGMLQGQATFLGWPAIWNPEKKVAFYEGRFVKGNSVDIVLLR